VIANGSVPRIAERRRKKAFWAINLRG
jgi:hypothetical protein